MNRFSPVRRLSALTVAMVMLRWLPAQAQVSGPDNQSLPVIDNVTPVLNQPPYSESLSAKNDASIGFESFSPLCGFRAVYAYKGGAAPYGVGWYNIDPLRVTPPTYPEDIVLLFDNSDAPGGIIDADVIRNDPNYAGGLIGFALVPRNNPPDQWSDFADQYHYTELKWDVFCSMCPTQGPWISILTYRSQTTPNRFYLTFEDLNVYNLPPPQGAGGNDFDFNDFIFAFDNVACQGSGEPCTVTSALGICQAGVTDCDSRGALYCRSLTQPDTRVDVCDGVDNNCDGTVDEPATATCPADQVCDRGACVRTCGGEVNCPRNFTCVTGRCVETTCIGVNCPSGQICRQGTCGDPCSGVVCPTPKICSAGECVDPCQGVNCTEPNTVCLNGACVTSCDCQPCPSGQSCQLSTRLCVQTGCETVTCAANETCRSGQCVSACQGVVCPGVQTCDTTTGQCTDPPPPPPDLTPPPDFTEVDMLPPPDLRPTFDGDEELQATGGGGFFGCSVTPGHPRGNAPVELGLGLLMLGWLGVRSRRRANRS